MPSHVMSFDDVMIGAQDRLSTNLVSQAATKNILFVVMSALKNY